MSEFKEQADSIVIVLARKDFGWSGEMVVNGDSASGCNGPNIWGVMDSLISSAFHDEVGRDALWTVDTV